MNAVSCLISGDRTSAGEWLNKAMGQNRENGRPIPSGNFTRGW